MHLPLRSPPYWTARAPVSTSIPPQRAGGRGPGWAASIRNFFSTVRKSAWVGQTKQVSETAKTSRDATQKGSWRSELGTRGRLAYDCAQR